MLIILILLYIQTNFCYNVTINSSNIPKECLLNYENTNFVSKSEILSNDEYKARQYYCNKDSDICVYTGKEDIASYIKFKDKNGNLKNYIAATCPYTYNITRCYGDEYKLINSDDYVYCSYKCTKDSDCLYNKCINNVCVYNEKSSIIHCEEIYTRVYKYFDHTYVHCGKPNHEFCSSNEECSSEKCKPRYTICATEQCSSEKYNSYCALNYFDPYGYKVFKMKLSIITIIAILINGIYCAKSKGTPMTGEYLELDNTLSKMYMFSNDECTKIYLCKTYKNNGILFISSHALSDCYLRNELINKEFNSGLLNNPDDCGVKGYADIDISECYLTNDKNEVTYKGKGIYHRARYYDTDLSNNRVLTEFGWCKFSNKIDSDTNWISRIINETLAINQITIPGTHDSGTYGIYNRIEARWAQTQNLDIYEQLLNGIRYLDIRLETNDDKEVYISHGYMDSINKKTGEKYYLSDIFDECVMFLKNNDKEFIILTLADENFDDEFTWDTEPINVPQYVANISVLNKNTKIIDKKTNTDFYLDDTKPYSDYFYVKKHVILNDGTIKGEDDTYISETTFPSIEAVRGKIVIYTKKKWFYDYGENQYPYGTLIRFPMMDKCNNYPIDYSYDYSYSNNPVHRADQYCYPTMNTDYNILFQDNTELDADDKIEIIKDTLSNNVSIKYDNEYNPSLYKEYSKDDIMTKKFYNGNDPNTLIINSMNIKGVIHSIESNADKINDAIRKYLDTPTLYNTWMLMDFPSSDIIRKIFKENINYTGVKRDIENNVIQIDDSTFYNDLDYFIVNDNSGCIQRKVNNQGNQKDSIKTNYKCVNNKKNKWRIEENSNYYRIRSSYDAKCLNYSNDGLFVDNCNGNNFEQIIIKDNKICSINNKCLDGKYTIKPTIIESPKYEHLTCSSRYIRAGYNCCDNQNARVEKVDDIGNWAKENGEWCGIGYERCSFERDMKINSIKAEFYDKNKFEETSKFIKLCYDYPDLSYGFYWLLRARSGYRLDARIAKAAKIVDQMCPNFCPCCKSNKQWISHWLIDCPFFNHTRSKVNDKILFLYNAFYRGNLTNDIVNSNNDNSNSNNSNSYNSNNNISNSIFSNVSNSIENNVYIDSSVCEKVFNFLLGGRSINNSTREWKDLFKCQMKSGAYSDTPFLVVTAALLQSIIPIAIGQQWSLFNRFKSNRTTTTKSVNAEETVRQASRASATNEDHNFVS